MALHHIARTCILLMALPALSAGAAAQTIHGNVENRTSSKPAAGDTVLLLAGAHEEARTTTAEDGTFSIPVHASDSHSSGGTTTLLVRVIHDGVYYDVRATPANAPIAVFDASPSVARITDFLAILQFQTKGSLLEVTELHALRNDSKPPITQAGPRNFSISIPSAAQLKTVSVAGPSDEPLPTAAIRVGGQPAQYAIPFPVKPGVTRYAVVYDMLYEGKFAFHRRVQYPTSRISVVLPSSMRFASRGRHAFHSTGQQLGSQVETVAALAANEPLAFELSGSGTLSRAFQPVAPSQSPAGRSKPPEAAAPAAGATITTPTLRPSEPAVTHGPAVPQPPRTSSAQQRIPIAAASAEALASWVSLAVAIIVAVAVTLWLLLSRKRRPA
jgi:hypothetical protein